MEVCTLTSSCASAGTAGDAAAAAGGVAAAAVRLARAAAAAAACCLSRSSSCGFEPDTGRLRRFSSAFRSLTGMTRMDLSEGYLHSVGPKPMPTGNLVL